jgi:hypothetical protein
MRIMRDAGLTTGVEGEDSEDRFAEIAVPEKEYV